MAHSHKAEPPVVQQLGQLVLNNPELLEYVLAKSAYDIGFHGGTLAAHTVLVQKAAEEAKVNSDELQKKCKECYERGAAATRRIHD